MRVFVAGGTGVLGQRLVPQLLARGHHVTASTTSRAKLGLLRELGADPVVMDGLNPASVRAAVTGAEPDVVVHQMTALNLVHAGKPSFKSERYFLGTNRLRTEGTDNVIAAAQAAGVGHLVAQSNATWNGPVDTGWRTPENAPLEVRTLPAAEAGMRPIRHLEDAVLRAGGAALRYGWFYGPGATDEQVDLIRKRQFPMIGEGAGVWSWIHLDDAAAATVLAVEQKAQGIYNIVDDEPAAVNEWLPHLATLAGAKPPRRLPAWLARPLAGELAVNIMNDVLGSSNAKARRELGWEPRYGSWRQGFREVVAALP